MWIYTPLRMGHNNGIVFAVGAIARVVRHSEWPGRHGNLLNVGGTGLRCEPRVDAVEAFEHVADLEDPKHREHETSL